MLTRRGALQLGAGGMACAGLGLGFAREAEAATNVSLDALDQGVFKQNGIKVLANADRIAVPSYRFGVVVRSGIAASAGSNSVRMEAAADLVGVSLDRLRSIADAALADFMEKLAATGREIVPEAEIRASEGYAKLAFTPVPFVKKPFADARTVAVVSPNGMPLLNTHFDSPMTDAAPFALGNWKAINKICADLKCVVAVPSVFIDFAQLSGSGHSVYGSGARVGIRPGLYVVPEFTRFTGYFAKIPLAGPLGNIILKNRVTIGEAGDLIQTSSANNRAEVDWWNRTASWNPNASPLARPSQAYDYSNYEYRVEPELFSEACLDGARAMNRLYAESAAANRPK